MADPFQGINATAEGPEDGRERLKGLISRHLDNLQVPQRHKDTVKYQVGTWVKFWEHFQGKEDQVVEAWAQFWSYRNDGQLQWDIKVVWGK
jgi:hypothetical protein